MTGLARIHEPVEVYLAAVGDPEPLARRIESSVHMEEWERDTLACFIRGELIPPKRKRGQKAIPYLENTEKHHRWRALENAAAMYREIMHRLNANGSNHLRRNEVLEYVAKHDSLNVETLDNYLRRSTKDKSKRRDTPKRVIVLFHQWLHRTGRLKDYDQPMGFLEWRYFQAQKGPRRR